MGPYMRRFSYIYIHARAPTPPHTRRLSSDKGYMPWFLPPNLSSSRVCTYAYTCARYVGVHAPVLVTTRTRVGVLNTTHACALARGHDHARTGTGARTRPRTLGVRAPGHDHVR
jgi:hypothetical protein